MKYILLLTIQFFCTISYSQSNSDYNKISKASELWGLIKYFHPYKPSTEFDSAFAAQVPKMLTASNESEWKTLISDWINILGDHSTRVVTSEKLKEGQMNSEFTNDSLLIVSISGSKFFDVNWVDIEKFLKSVVDQSKNAKGVIFDLRQETPISQSYEGYSNYYFDSFGINKYFGTDQIPQYKTIYYSGYKPERGFTSGAYTVNDVLQNSMSPGNSPAYKQKVVWITNKYSELPIVALSQQASETGFILNDLENIDHLLPLTRTFQFSENISVKFRIANVVMPGSLESKADYVYSDSENLMEVSKELILNTKEEKQNKYIGSKTVRSDSSSSYPTDIYPLIGYRILAAAKIYSIIKMFFPYYDLMDKNWENVLRESLPDFVNAQNEVEYGLAVAKMYANINDSHGFITGNKGLEKLRGEAVSPVEVEWIEDKIVVTSLRNDSICKINGVKVGDVILKINGVPVKKLMDKYLNYFAYSTIHRIKNTASRLCVKGPEGEKAIFSIQDNRGKIRDINFYWSNELNNLDLKFTIDTLALLDGNIGYADLTRMEASQTDQMFEMFKNSKAIIFDMRGYPNGTAWSISPRLTEKHNVPLALFRKPEILSPNILTADIYSNKSYTEFLQTITPSDKWKYKGKTVMLINQNAISQAEHTGLFFESVNNTVFIGSPTAGANGDVTNFEIPGGMFLSFSGQGVWHADGRQLQRVGLQPHVLVKPTIKGIRAGKDEVLEKAIEWINKNVK